MSSYSLLWDIETTETQTSRLILENTQLNNLYLIIIINQLIYLI